MGADMSRQTTWQDKEARMVRYEIAQAIQVGLGRGWESSQMHCDEVLIRVAGHTRAIVVSNDDVVLPEDLRPLASGIMLDVQSILADRMGGTRREPWTLADVAAYEAHMADIEAEYERLRRLPRVRGCEAVNEHGECEGCGNVTVLYGRDACTLGYPGHPGAEFTTFQVCERCLTR